jgi:hypothetical protein
MSNVSRTVIALGLALGLCGSAAAETLDEASKATLRECQAKWTGADPNDPDLDKIPPMVCQRWNHWLVENHMTPMWPIEDEKGCYDWKGVTFCKKPQPKVIERKVYVPVPVPVPQPSPPQRVIIERQPTHCWSQCDGFGLSRTCYQDCD